MYRVNGYPVIEALDKDRDPVPLKITHDNPYTDAGRNKGPAPLTLAPGESATAHLHWTNRITSFDAARQGAYLKVAPAPGEAARIRPFFLDIGTDAQLDVTAWGAKFRPE
ncbi:DUF4232 domain-containing protein [Streptomyces sp. NPDC058000]|uniref:DUF4232 domain-containing protein n=1 Tax=Streptomyces sp. NPDC058000 TaxID=3346299 RepID=UPI0036E25D01